MPYFKALGCHRTLLKHVAVGMGAASFWRGAWYLLDDHLFPENRPLSAGASLSLGIAGMAASQGLVERAEKLAKKTSTKPWALKTARIGALYTVAVSCVLVWRGTWLGWDCAYEYFHPQEDAKSTDPGHATHSGLLSHVVAVSLLFGTGLFASVLAPPAAVSVIRDLAVKAGQQPPYGPAQLVASRLFGGLSASNTQRALSTTGALKKMSYIKTTVRNLK